MNGRSGVLVNAKHSHFMRKTAIFLPPLLVPIITNHVSLLLFTIRYSIPRDAVDLFAVRFSREYVFGNSRVCSRKIGYARENSGEIARETVSRVI